MKKIYKGNPGYLKSRKIKLLIGTLAGILLIVAIYATGYIIFETPKNYVTILAVLAVLPVAKILIQYLMVPWKNNVDPAEYEELRRSIEPLPLYCEFMITAQEKRFPVLYLVIDKNENIIAYTKNEKADCQAFEKGVVNFLNYYDFDTKVKLYTDLKQFTKKAKQLAGQNAEITEEQKEHILYIYEKISIMSV